MVLEGTDAPGATPLTADELEELIPDHIGTRKELDEWEARNILSAMHALRGRRPSEVLDDHFLRDLHRRMFGDTWRWAGRYRTRTTNLGIPPPDIAVAVRNLCQDKRLQRDEGVFPPDELAIRFHHELVFIHPFPNGNGRHSRLAADLLIESMGGQRFSWGRADLARAGDSREAYLHALRRADVGEIEPLLAFARS